MVNNNELNNAQTLTFFLHQLEKKKLKAILIVAINPDDPKQMPEVIADVPPILAKHLLTVTFEALKKGKPIMILQK